MPQDYILEHREDIPAAFHGCNEKLGAAIPWSHPSSTTDHSPTEPLPHIECRQQPKPKADHRPRRWAAGIPSQARANAVLTG
ncbi:hypothetical protein N7530_000794 [Penicillium desertorum]|uniref:Uncharacterized protein n=1 Tax=Penicillium desertorum TaxID=1303715 RepID=A0A9X0BVR0_9EURO|nr:hypothetical protein N7530_000794 [Penicillium desertorum]